MVRIITGTENQIDEMEATRIRAERAEAEVERFLKENEQFKAAANTPTDERVRKLEERVKVLGQRVEHHSHYYDGGRITGDTV